MQNFTFYILVGSQVLKSSLANVEGFRGQLEYYFRPHPTGVGPVFRVVETKDAFYLHCWGREITALHRLDNHAPLVLYPDYDFDLDKVIIKAFLHPLTLWNPGQFGIWSFAADEGVGEPEVSRPESICILCGEERPLEKTISEYPLLKLCCACFDSYQTLTRLTCKDVDDFSVIGTFRSDHCSLLRTANAKIDKERKKRVCAALQYGKQHWGSKT